MEKTYHVYKGQLLDSTVEPAWNKDRKSIKHFAANPPCQQARHLRFSQSQLDAWTTCNCSIPPRSGVQAFWDPQRAIRESGALPLLLFSEDPVICPNCGHVDIVSHGSPPPKVVRLASQALISKYKKVKGISILDRTDEFEPVSLAPASWNRRWKCKRCSRTFRWGVDKGLKFPFELWGVVLSCFIEGDDLKRINKEVAEAAEWMGIEVSSLSSEAVYNIVERFCLIMGYFEPIAIRKFADREVKLGTVQLDYSPYTLYTAGSRIKQLDLKNRGINFHKLRGKLSRKELNRLGVRIRVPIFVTGAIDEESHYPLPMVTDYSFDYKRSLECLRLMVYTIGGKPHTLKCDGARCHINPVKMYIPDVNLNSRTKAQCYNIVNILERYWEELKQCLRRYRFMSLRTAQLAVEFKRLEYAFLRPNSYLNGRTPAEALGIKIPRSIIQNDAEKWQRMLKLAYKTIVLEKYGDLKKLCF